jgi:hypothetical protein
VTDTEIVYLGHPAHRGPADEGLHAPPPEAGDRLFGDTVWLSVIDPAQGIWGLCHMHQCPNRGFGRFAAYMCIDGVEHVYLGKQVGGLAYGDMRWSDGRMSYEVLEPYRRIRVALDGPRFGLDLEYTHRHVVFDYDDCVGGSPLEGLAPAAGIHGGHYEQAMNVRGTFSIHGGPAAGQTRPIDTIAHRDHTWSDRFSGEAPWAYPEGVQASLHYWLVLHFPERNFNVTGFFDLSPLGIHRPIDRVGGFESSERGARRIVGAGPAPREGTDGPAEPRGTECPLRWRLEFEDGEVLHVTMPRVHWLAKLRMLGEDDAESRLNDYETYGELVIDETGERGFGQFEHSTLPPDPRWLR